MSGPAFRFEDGPAYERCIGRWSRAVAPTFLEWLRAPRCAAWLDVGCGTGILAETVLELCAPASVDAVDASPAQVEAAAKGAAGTRADFRVADAQSLPFGDGRFDVVASALAINFMADSRLALAEMRRVARAGGRVGAYVWDLTADLSPTGPLRRALRRIGADFPPVPGTEGSRMDRLVASFEAAGLERIETRTVDVCLAYTDFDDFWRSHTPSYVPTTPIIARMKGGERARLVRALQSELPVGPNGSIEYFVRANAIKARRRPPRG